MYGWYSLESYKSGSTEYVYLNTYGQETYCTHITPDKKTPIYSVNYIYMGELSYYLRVIPTSMA